MKYNNVIEYNQKPIIIAICGKSASGKTIFATWLQSVLKSKNIPCGITLSDTTRPIRYGETPGVDYHFISGIEFYKNISEKKYLEFSCFNGWYYGTPKNQIINYAIKNGEKIPYINIGIYNADGLKSLMKNQKDYKIICVYLKANLPIRLKRMIHREKKFKYEYLRRIAADTKDFKNIKQILNNFKYQMILDSNSDGVVKKVDTLLIYLKNHNLI